MPGTKGRSGGHNRKSVAQHRLAGTYRKDRHGGLAETAPAAPAPLEAPAHLTGDALTFWQALAPELQAAGRLTVLDLPRFELLCIHLGFHRTLYARLNAMLEKMATSGTPVDTSRIHRSLRQEADTFRALSVGFGLDAGDRGRLHVTAPSSAPNPLAAIAPNPLDRFLNRTKSKWAGVLP